MKKPIIISLGGSLVVPDDIDIGFVEHFRTCITEEVARGREFYIIVGGGKVCRRYQSATEKLGISSSEQLDWIGIHVTRLNANFIRIVLGDLAHEEVMLDPHTKIDYTKPVVVGAGFKPGHSTDFDAVEIAYTLGAEKIINLSNIEYAYDKDPRVFPDAKKIEKTTWEEFRKILPTEWTPGVNAPFDPIAAKRAHELSLEVAILHGKNIDNLKKYLAGEAFIGTVITA